MSWACRCRRCTKALLSAEAFLPAFRDALIARGIHGYQVYATGDVGTIAYETPAREGLVVDEGVIVEIVRPGTGDPVAAGEVGEVVVTLLHNTDYPLIRFGTGDLSATLPGPSPCGRTNLRIKGWMGRADQTTKVKGMFVHPSQVAAILKRHPEIARARLVVDNPDGNDRMVLHVEMVRQRAARCGSDRRRDSRCHQVARRSDVPQTRRTAQRRQGHRRHTQVRLRFLPSFASVSANRLRIAGECFAPPFCVLAFQAFPQCGIAVTAPPSADPFAPLARRRCGRSRNAASCASSRSRRCSSTMAMSAIRCTSSFPAA